MLHVALTVLVLGCCAAAIAVVGFGFFDAFSRRSRTSNKNPGKLRADPESFLLERRDGVIAITHGVTITVEPPRADKPATGGTP